MLAGLTVFSNIFNTIFSILSAPGVCQFDHLLSSIGDYRQLPLLTTLSRK